jgi:hypothetical protein
MTLPDLVKETNEVPTNAVARASTLLERRISRRGMLVRLTILGSALTLGPLRYLLYPETALAACGTANCSGTSCPGACGNGCGCTTTTCCNDPNSTFCCTLYGSNVCPGGTSLCGSWSCGNTGLKMMDCCSTSCGSCVCANNQCGNRRTCCFNRLYGNCGSVSGKIVCRITRWSNSCFPCSTPDVHVPNCTSFPSCAANPPC